MIVPNIECCRLAQYQLRGRMVIAIIALMVWAFAIDLCARSALALPLYARQTGQPCATCHTAFLELTPFGRRFKLGGYTLGGGDWKGPPFAVMLQPTFTNTQAPQPGGAAPGFGVNNNLVMQQMSLFTNILGTRTPSPFAAPEFTRTTIRAPASASSWPTIPMTSCDH